MSDTEDTHTTTILSRDVSEDFILEDRKDQGEEEQPRGGAPELAQPLSEDTIVTQNSSAYGIVLPGSRYHTYENVLEYI